MTKYLQRRERQLWPVRGEWLKSVSLVTVTLGSCPLGGYAYCNSGSNWIKGNDDTEKVG
jgi:hypothetical protein